MPPSRRPINPRRDDFAAEVTGVDVAAGVSKTVAAEIEAAMDRYAVLVLPGQAITDEQQYAFSQHFGPMETATGDIARTEDRRLRSEEHTSELQSLMRISYAVFCLHKHKHE